MQVRAFEKYIPVSHQHISQRTVRTSLKAFGSVASQGGPYKYFLRSI